MASSDLGCAAAGRFGWGLPLGCTPPPDRGWGTLPDGPAWTLGVRHQPALVWPPAPDRAVPQRGRVEQTIDELLNGHDFDHLVSYRLHPNRVAVGFRLLSRNLAIGLQLATAEPSPGVIREPRAFRAAHVDGLGTFSVHGWTIILRPLRPMASELLHLSWTRQVVHLAA